MANFSGISNETWIGKLLRAPLRLIPPKAVIPILQGPLRGQKWIVGSGTHGCWLGSYENEKQLALQSKLKQGDVMYDIGANVGYYSLLASVLVGHAGYVYSFEPSAANVQAFKKHLRMNHIGNCTLIEAAVGSFDGESAFDPSADRHTGRLAASGRARVRVVTLDHLVADAGARPPNLIKIDIEGAELDCLCGAAHVIQRYRPVIFLATHSPDLHRSSIEILRNWNYCVSSLGTLPVEITDELVALPA